MKRKKIQNRQDYRNEVIDFVMHDAEEGFNQENPLKDFGTYKDEVKQNLNEIGDKFNKSVNNGYRVIIEELRKEYEAGTDLETRIKG